MTTESIEVVAVEPETKQRVSKCLAWARALTITTPEQYTDAVAALKGIKTLRNNIEDFFKDSREKAHATWKAIVANAESFTDSLDEAERTAKAECTRYQLDEEEKRVAEQRRLQAAADEAARKERERLEREAAKLKTPELKAARMEAAAAVVAPVIQVAPVAEPVKGAALRKTWKARVVNAALVPREYLSINQQALDAFAKATRGAVALPGVEMYEDVGMSVSVR